MVPDAIAKIYFIKRRSDVTLQVLQARAAVKPFFGVSGQYAGELYIKGKKAPATLSIVDFQKEIRGVINTKFKYKDEQGIEWEGTDIFVKGKRNKNDELVSLFASSMRCHCSDLP